MDFAAMTAALVAWVTANVAGGTSVFYGEPNGPRFPLPAVRLKLRGPFRLGLDELTPSDAGDLAFTLTGPRGFSLSVTAYGDNAQSVAAAIETSLGSPATMATLSAAGLSSLGTSDVRDLSVSPDETRIEQRFQFDVELLATNSVTVSVDVIEHVEATGAVGGNSIPIIVDKTP